MMLFLLNLGLETLFLRVERHCQNAMEVAKFLEAQEQVEWINYPGLPSKEVLPAGTEIYAEGHLRRHCLWREGRQRSRRQADGGSEAGVYCDPCGGLPYLRAPSASTTHRQLNEQQLKECGVEPNMIRMSVGIEDVEDIIADLKQAFEKLS